MSAPPKHNPLSALNDSLEFRHACLRLGIHADEIGVLEGMHIDRAFNRRWHEQPAGATEAARLALAREVMSELLFSMPTVGTWAD